MNGLRIYNSYVRDKQLFEPLVPGHVGMYVCGPTVSGESHLGHARPYITFDIVYRYLRHLGYKVRYVRNITDAGHFEEEGREAEDKISKKAVIEKLEPMELVHKYTHLYHWAMEQFNNLPPSIEPTVTGHIVEQIEMIKGLIQSGYAYEVAGSVYFDVSKYAAGHDYGKLSGRVVDELLQTTRELEGQSEKRNTADFALWKSAPPEHIMRWPSPWGEGFPGWHIECSAMATKYLGKQFDIHGGGMDLLFPHHESEIAQSTISNGVAPVRYWMHNNMITINGRKMGKSYNNVIKLTELFTGDNPQLEKAYSPMTVRFFILQTHYRSTLDFSNEGLLAAEKGLRRLMEAYGWLKRETTADKREERPQGENPSRLSSVVSPSDDEESVAQKVTRLLDSFPDHMNDDFGMARVLASMFELVPIINSLKDGTLTGADLPADLMQRAATELQVWIEDIFGLKPEEQGGGNQLQAVMEVLISIRKNARARKDWMTSDAIRNDLEKAGILLKDEKNGEMSWTLK